MPRLGTDPARVRFLFRVSPLGCERMSVIYRQATPDDAEACARIIRDWDAEMPWTAPLNDLATMTAFWTDFIASHPAWIAEQGGKVAGFALRNDGNLAGLYVVRGARNHGIGKALLDLARDGQQRLEAWAYEANPAARRFYRREGFVEFDREIEESSGLMEIGHLWQAPPP